MGPHFPAGGGGAAPPIGRDGVAVGAAAVLGVGPAGFAAIKFGVCAGAVSGLVCGVFDGTLLAAAEAAAVVVAPAFEREKLLCF